jgi:hypothetical protein
MGQFTKRVYLECDSSWLQALTRLAAVVVSSSEARRDVLRIVVTVALTAVIIAGLGTALLIVRPEMITAFASMAASR